MEQPELREDDDIEVDDMLATETSPEDRTATSPADQIEQPAKVVRLATMIQRLLEEVRAAPLDEASRRRLAELHADSVTELKGGLSPELAAELERLARPFTPEHPPSDDELRIAQAQLVGWLEGLFQGIQTAMMAQQMAARAQLERGPRQLAQEPGPLSGPHMPGPPQHGQGGMYL